MKKFLIISLLLSSQVFCLNSWSKAQPPASAPKFDQAEENFKKVMKVLMDEYIDKNLTQEQLYQAATAGMLNSLNTTDQKWNKLYDPLEYQELEIELTGKVSGIGAEMKYDDNTGYATILRVIPNSGAEKAGLKADDQILSVDGEKFKGKGFPKLVQAIRGEVGKSVSVKILREDKIQDFRIKRQVVPWTPIDLEFIDKNTALLTIGVFNQETPKRVAAEIEKINKSGVKKVIIDVRDNAGGSFTQAVKTTELFLPKDSLVVSTKNRRGETEVFKSTSGLIASEIKIYLLVDKTTSSGAEFFTAALQEIKGAKLVGETTLGKWNAQSLEMLSNKFAIKYTVKQFFAPNGKSYQDVGLKPDLEISLPEKITPRELKVKNSILQRLGFDAQLKAAFEISKTN